MAVEWGLLGPLPDIPGAVRQGMEYGRAQRLRQKQDSAFSSLAADPTNPSALAALVSTGQQGMQAAWALQDRAKAEHARQLRQNILSPQPSAFGMPANAPPAPEGAPQSVMDIPRAAPAAPSAASQTPYNMDALRQYFVEDPDGAKEILGFIKGQDEQSRKALQEELSAGGPLLLQLMSTPDIEQRRAIVEQARPMLNAMGWDSEEIAQRTGDLSDRTLKAYVALGAGMEHYSSIFKPDRPHYIALPPGGRLVLDPASGGSATPEPAPQIGAVETDDETGEQYRFKGGDRSDPAAWEKIGGAGSGPGTFP